ncbi:MAG: transposase [Chloroflexi bacterium]|nr:transposase [Chloroflexota bacterium]
MIDYDRLSAKPKQFHALTGYTLEEFDALLPTFTDRFAAQMQAFTLAGKPRQRPYVSYDNSPLPTMADKLLFLLMYLRKATTQDIFGEVFGMPQPVANQWIHRLHDCLNQALAKLGANPARKAADLDLADDEVKLYFQDGTERPIQRPKDPEVQESFYSGKKKRHTVKNNVLVNAQGEIVLLTATCEGKKHDKKIADEAGFTLPEGSLLYQDTGFQGFALEGTTIFQPKKKPRGGELTPDEKAQNRLISRIRVRVEHAIDGVKRYRIVKDQLRNWKPGFRDKVMETCCGLHNFRLRFRPWAYFSVIT